MGIQSLTSADTVLINTGLIAIGLAFFHHWREGSSWSPLLGALGGSALVFVAMLLGLNDSHILQPALMFLATAPLAYYLIGVVRYALLVRSRHRDLKKVWSNVRTGNSCGASPIHFWNALSYAGFEKAYHRVDAAAKAANCQAALAVFHGLIAQHRDTLTRKKAQHLYRDEYEVIQEQDWKKQARYFIGQVFLPELKLQGIEVNTPISEWVMLLDEEISHPGLTQPGNDLAFTEVSSGVEYEHYVARLLKAEGWTAEMTPGSGDHGADIIASQNGFRVAVQCKLYSSPVGNGSVQEVYSAKDFYGCHFAVVVSNAEYTRQAKKISSNLGVALVHHEGLLKVINTAKTRRAT